MFSLWYIFHIGSFSLIGIFRKPLKFVCSQFVSFILAQELLALKRIKKQRIHEQEHEHRHERWKYFLFATTSVQHVKAKSWLIGGKHIFLSYPANHTDSKRNHFWIHIPVLVAIVTEKEVLSLGCPIKRKNPIICVVCFINTETNKISQYFLFGIWTVMTLVLLCFIIQKRHTKKIYIPLWNVQLISARKYLWGVFHLFVKYYCV